MYECTAALGFLLCVGQRLRWAMLILRIGAEWYSWWMYFGMPCCSLWLTCTRVVPRGGSVPGGGYFGTVDGGRTYLGWYSFFLPSVLHFLLRPHILSGRVFLIGPPHKYFMSFLAGGRTALPRLLAFLPDWLLAGWMFIYERQYKLLLAFGV